jgi:hypothetical protein
MKNVKKINSMKKTILMSSVFMLSLTSCEPTTYYKKIIENNSSKVLTVLIEKSSNQVYVDTVQINAGTNYTVLESEEMGYSDEVYSDCKKGQPLSYIHPIDSIEVRIENSPDWIFEHTDKNNGLKHWVNCRFVVTDEMY